MAIRIVTDSVSDLPSQVAQDHGITVVPLYVAIGGETYRDDGVEITLDRFYQLLAQLPDPPTTSQPNIADFQDVYRQLLDEGHSVVSIHASSKLSGTLNSASQARESLDAGSRIEVLDSQLGGGAQALLALSAARWTGEMSDHRELARRVEGAIGRHRGFTMLDTLSYMARGGRIGRARVFLGGALQVRPILTMQDGEPHPVERPRTRRRAMSRMVQIMRDLAPVSQLYISYSTGREDAKAIRDRLADLVEPESIIESRFGPVLGTHLGPNTIGVAATLSGPEDH